MFHSLMLPSNRLWVTLDENCVYKDMLKVGVVKGYTCKSKNHFGDFSVPTKHYTERYIVLSSSMSFYPKTFYWFHNKVLIRTGFLKTPYPDLLRVWSIKTIQVKDGGFSVVAANPKFNSTSKRRE